jgi:hypothetical protein
VGAAVIGLLIEGHIGGEDEGVLALPGCLLQSPQFFSAGRAVAHPIPTVTPIGYEAILGKAIDELGTVAALRLKGLVHS